MQSPETASPTRPHGRSIRRKLIHLSLVSILPLAFVTIGVAWGIWQSYARAVESTLQETAAAMSLAVERDIATVRGQLNAVAASHLIDDRDWTKLHAFMVSITGDRPGAVVSLVDPAGQVVIQSNIPPGQPLPNLWVFERVDEQAYWQGQYLPLSSQGLTRAVIAGARPVASGLYLSLLKRQPTVALSVPVMRGGQVSHALTYSFPTASLQTFLGSVAAAPGLQLELLDRNGVVIASAGAGSAAVGSRRTSAAGAAADTAAAAAGAASASLLSSRSVSSLTGWTVLASEPRSVAFGRIRNALGTWLVGLALLVAGAVFASIALARRIAAPLHELAGRALGETETVVATQRSNILEIDALADHLQRAALAERERHADMERRIDAEHRERVASAQAVSYRARSDELRVALDAGQMGTWRLDFRSGRISVDPRLCTLWDLDDTDGLRPDIGGELDASTILGRIHRDDAGNASVSQYRDVDESRASQPFRVEFRVPTRDGGWRWLASYGNRLRDANGTVIGMIGVNFDVTARREAEQALRALEKERESLLLAERAARSMAENSNRTKDDFLATLSHELRSPLAVIVGWSQVLLGRHGQEDPELARGLRLILSSGMAQSQLISDLLDMSTITAGKMQLAWRPADLNDIVEESVAGQRPAAQEKGVALSLELDRSPVFVRADTERLRQVIGNLLSNAFKFTPRGGHVTVRITGGTSTAEVSVADDGQGIDPDFLPRLFDRYSQAQGSADRRRVGMGLGMAIVRQLVELHGGQVRAHSDGPGRGSTFTVELPLLDEGRPDLLVDAPGVTHSARTRVLVVEDQEGMRDYLTRIFQDAGMQVTSTASGAEALKVLQQQAATRPQLLVSDVGMPDLDGYQLMERIRDELGLDASTLPAIAVTAFSRTEDRDRAIKAGFQVHCVKPVQATRLIELARVLANQPPGGSMRDSMRASMRDSTNDGPIVKPG